MVCVPLCATKGPPASGPSPGICRPPNPSDSSHGVSHGMRMLRLQKTSTNNSRHQQQHKARERRQQTWTHMRRTMFNTPAGRPASCAIVPRNRDVSGVISEGCSLKWCPATHTHARWFGEEHACPCVNCSVGAGVAGATIALNTHLQHHCTASSECGSNCGRTRQVDTLPLACEPTYTHTYTRMHMRTFPRCHEQWIVPRNDGSNYADRFVLDDCESIRTGDGVVSSDCRP